MAGMLDYTKEPRWSYPSNREAKPSGMMPKKQWEGVQTTTSEYMADYKLPATDVQTERRNFAGYTEENFVTQDMLTDKVGDVYGSTDTDTFTDPYTNGPRNYTKINQRPGKPGRSWSSSSPRQKTNSPTLRNITGGR